MLKKWKKDILIDWAIAGLLILWCFISYQHADIRHTGGSAFAYLNGHIRDFYDYNIGTVGGCSYMPTTYILFALWNIPLRVLGIVTDATMNVGLVPSMWYKVFTTLLYAGTAYILYKICRELNVEKKYAYVVAFLFVTNPIAVFSQFCFGQYDIITTFFCILGFYFYIKKQNWKFVFSFAVALTCKYFALLFFVPLLLMREKRVLHIIKNMIGVVSIFAVELLFYWPSEGFRDHVFGFGAAGYLYNLTWDVGGIAEVSLVPLAWLLVCGYAFFADIKEDDQIKWGIYLLNVVTFVTFGMSNWHPQWLLMAVPFWTLGVMYCKRKDIYMLLEVLLWVLYLMYSVQLIRGAAGELLLAQGVFADVLDFSRVGVYYSVADIFIDSELMFTCFVGVLAVYVFYKHPAFNKNAEIEEFDKCKGVMRFRYIFGILFFIVPTVLVAIICMTGPKMIGGTAHGECDALGGMNNYEVYGQVMELDADTVEGVSIVTGTFGYRNDSYLTVKLVSMDDMQVLGEKTVRVDGFKDCSYNRIMFDEPIAIESGEDYMFTFRASEVDEDINATRTNCITLYTAEETATEESYVIKDGVTMNYNIAMRVWGRSE